MDIQKIDKINVLIEDVKIMLNTYSSIFEKISFTEMEKISIENFLFTKFIWSSCIRFNDCYWLFTD